MKELKRLENQCSGVMLQDKQIILRELRSIKRALAKSYKKAKSSPEYRPHTLETIPKQLRTRITKLSQKTDYFVNKIKARKTKKPSHIRYNPNLPITSKKDEIIKAIKENRVVIISGETGSGKTTQIPKFCLEAGRGIKGLIGCTQPRRIAAITVARRIAQELGESLGHAVGYKIRFDDKSKGDAYIKLMTDGILLAETQTDPFLNTYDTIIVDEAHERSLNIDFTLGILRQLVKKRKDLKLIITSATIDTEKFSKAFDDAPIIEVSGRMYPVETIYSPFIHETDDKQTIEDQGYVEAAADAVSLILSQSRKGDILVFMPTEQDIGETLEIIRGKNHPGIKVYPLFARLSAKEQSKIFSRGAGRKVIVSTNVAETSLTIPGIKYVVDTGLARIPSYSPRTRTTALPVSPISQSSANQRQGRCGRIENGICIRLYDEEDFGSRPFFTSPEILRSNLAEVILRMISLHLGDVSVFPFIDSPSPKSIKDGFDTLIELGAIKAGKNKYNRKREYTLSMTGRIMAKLPIDPKLSRILIEANKNGCLHEAIIITTALAISDPRQRPAEKAQTADQKHALFKDPSSDFITLLNIWQAYKNAEKKYKSRSKLKRYCQDHFLSFKRLREWDDIRSQIQRIVTESSLKADKKIKAGPNKTNPGVKGLKAREFEIGGPQYISLHKSLLSGYLANIAHKKEKNIFNAAKGQQAMIFPGSGLFNSAGNWIVAAEFVKTSLLFARTVANIDPEWLEQVGKALCTYTYSDPHWEKKRGEVVAKEQVSLFGLIIVNDRKKAYGKINPEESGEIFIRHALVRGETHQIFKFMRHNKELIDELETLEHKTRKKDILASEDDMYSFYHSKLPRPFYNIRTFSKFVKDNDVQNSLKMTLADLQKSSVDEDELSMFPDKLLMGNGKFNLEYAFNPGSKKDGITIKVPAASVSSVSKNSVARLVPGLFQEKVTALIKSLPKVYRVKLVPVSEKAVIIASEMPREDRPLFALLSAFILARFNISIPATAWSEKDLPDHLKMRISIRDTKGREIHAHRNTSILDTFSVSSEVSKNDPYLIAKKKYERTDIQAWDFDDLTDDLIISKDDDFVQKGFLRLKSHMDKTSRTKTLSLCLFKDKVKAESSHCNGIRHLFEKTYPDDFKALKKDIKTAPDIKRIAPLFDGQAKFSNAVYNMLINSVFKIKIMTRSDFESIGNREIKTLYNRGQGAIKMLSRLGNEYQACFELLQDLSFKHQSKKKTFDLLTHLFSELKNLVPPNFTQLYTYRRIEQLHRYVTCIKIRTQRTVDNPLKEEKKAIQLNTYTRHLNQLLSSLNEDSSTEKADAIEQFYWMLEEYKISIFAQELKTHIKISAKKLDNALKQLSTLV